MGPTASGKTDLAVALVERYPFEIISVDSAMVYRGMDIGTAKPDERVLQKAPHRLIDICDPAEAYSAARFREDALAAMGQIVAAGRIPLLVGGTMLYFSALDRGLSDLPPADAQVRARLEALGRQHGWDALHRRLGEVDAAAARRIHPNDPQRIQRALEVFELTGRPMTELQRRGRDRELPYEVLRLALVPADRSVLHERIAARFRRMLEQGFVAEVEQLLRVRGLDRSLPSMRCVGYRQVCEFLDGSCSRERMVERGIAATRQLSKRQMTWLRSYPGVHWLVGSPASVLDGALKLIEDVLSLKKQQ